MLNLLSKAGRPTLACVILLCVIYALLFPSNVLADEGDTLDINNLGGEPVALVNAKYKVAMLAEENDGQTLKGESVPHIVVDNGKVVVEVAKADISKIKTWTFEKVENTDNNDEAVYHLATGIGDEKQYIQINRHSNGSEDAVESDVTLTNVENSAAVIRVVEGEAGQVKLMGKVDDGRETEINLFGGTLDRGFGGWKDDSDNVWFYISDVAEIGSRTVAGQTPAGTVINMFDYWTDDRKAPDGNGNKLNEGINKGHALKFRVDQGQIGSMNNWTGTEETYSGIVEKVLKNGYPFLTDEEVAKVNKDMGLNYLAESLNYLFDPSANTENRKVFRNVSGLLQNDEDGYHYYDSKKNFAELTEKNGNDNTAEKGNKIKLYDTWGVSGGGKANIDGQFFPFNKFSEVYNIKADDSKMNHYFGMTLTSRFVQQYDGHTKINRKDPMTFEFSGDDDVWIFIDDVLVADLGGIHDRSSVKIDFSSGEVIINDDAQSKITIYQQYVNAGKADSVSWSDVKDGEGKIFENGSFHTLKFFYLERGNKESNLSLKYNLSPYPETDISKVDQYGKGVEGARFAVYAADDRYNMRGKDGAVVAPSTDYTYNEDGDIINAEGETLAKALYMGTTDENGKMVFRDEDNENYTIAELEKMFGSKFILKEIQAPEGYRQVGAQVELEIVNHNILVSNNPEESGAQAAATLQVDAPCNLALVNDKINVPDKIENGIVNYYNPEDPENKTNGNVFAVVLRYIGQRDENGKAIELNKQASWAPVYGTQKEGFTVVDMSKYNGNEGFIQAAIETVSQYHESTQFFEEASNGAMQGKLNGLPGDIRNYYYMLGENENDKGKTEYTVAYYYTTANDLKEAKPDNTWRINSDSADDSYSFYRMFGSTINIPNLANKLLVQKRNEDDNLVNGAGFAMYKVEEEDNKVYYIADDSTKISLEKDTDGDNSGNAFLKDAPGTNGTYVVQTEGTDNKVGTITVKFENKSYTITPEQNGVTQYDKDAKEKGTIVFTNLSEGKYYIREISAPEGYKLNTSEVMALVTQNSIYANAGTAGDGVVVGRGPGYIVSTLDTYASGGQIDNTLRWLYAQMKISGVSNTFNEVTAEKYQNWKYITENKAIGDEKTTDKQIEALTSYLEYSLEESDNTLFNYTLNEERGKIDNTSENASDTRRLYTDVGWSYLEIYQDYEYGKDKKAAGADYNDWRTHEISGTDSKKEQLDLSHLFSRSVYIQVTDKPDKVPVIPVNPVTEKGNLTISKAVVGSGADTDKAFAFTVTLKDAQDQPLSESFNYTGPDSAGSDTIRSGGTIKLKDGQSITIKDLPEGTRYEVTEVQEEGSGYTVSADGDTGTIVANTTKTAAFTNTKGTGTPGELLIGGAKTISGREFKEGDTFTFTVTAPKGTPMPERSQVTIKPTGGTQAAVDFGKISFTEENVGKTYTYTFVEKAGDISGISYDTVEKTVTVKVGKDQDGKLVLTVDYGKDKNPLLWQNEYKSGDLTVSKTVSGDKADKTKEFHFTVTLSEKLTGTYGDMQFKDGVAEFTLKHGEHKTAAGLPEGTKYSVTEAEANKDGYKTTSEGSKGVISTGTAAASFLNHKDENSKPEDPTKPGENTDPTNPTDPGNNGGNDNPSKPSDGSDKPNKPNTPGTQNPDTPNATRTGDDSNMALWLGLLIASLAVITAVGLYTRRQKQDAKK